MRMARIKIHDRAAVYHCISRVVGGQWLLGTFLRLVPVSGYDTGIYAGKFVILPVVIGLIGGLGSGVRWYRTIFLEEMGKDYVRTARAKGLPESMVLFKHALKNAMIPILTGVVVTIPLLFIGSLVLESFFAIPGMGNFTLEAIQRQDFAILGYLALAHGNDLALLGLFLGGVGDDDTGCGRGLLFETLYDDPVMQRSNVHDHVLLS